MKNIIITTMANWVSEEVREGLDAHDFKVIKDYGFDILLPFEDIYAWWMPAAHAARVVRAMPELKLIAPGSDWLTTIPEHLTCRKISILTLQELLSEPFTGKLWVKPAEAKIEPFPALFYSYDELQNIANMSSLEATMNVQYTKTFIPFNWEHRFYVLQGKVTTGSPYLVDGVTFNDGVPWDGYEDALKYAQYAVGELAENQPPAYVLDIGLDEITGKWAVIEANPAWCSGFYGADMNNVILCIHESMKHDAEWQWIPDPHLDKISQKKVLLKKS